MDQLFFELRPEAASSTTFQLNKRAFLVKLYYAISESFFSILHLNETEFQSELNFKADNLCARSWIYGCPCFLHAWDHDGAPREASSCPNEYYLLLFICTVFDIPVITSLIMHITRVEHPHCHIKRRRRSIKRWSFLTRKLAAKEVSFHLRKYIN